MKKLNYLEQKLNPYFILLPHKSKTLSIEQAASFRNVKLEREKNNNLRINEVGNMEK